MTTHRRTAPGEDTLPTSALDVVVVGSLNIDLIAQVERLPARGQTVIGARLVRRFGGKGANQAVAAARQGARVCLIGAVGADADGTAYRARLKTEGIDTEALVEKPKTATGTALIAVDRHGENTIIVCPGANGQLTARDVHRARQKTARAQVVLLQFEVPPAAVSQAIQLARRAGARVVLNPSPWSETFSWGEGSVDCLIVNEGEAQALFGKVSDRANLQWWQRQMRRRKVARLVITRGSQSTLCLDSEGSFEVPTFQVKPTDTVGAGDTFAGTFAARYAEGLAFAEAVKHANAAAALATLGVGAQEAMPSQAATERLLSRPQ